MRIELIVFPLADKFPEYDWDVYFDEQIGKFCVLVNDYEFYKSDKYRKWTKILRMKHPEVKWFGCFKKFKH